MRTPRGVTLLVFGVAMIVAAGLWWWTSQPDESETFTTRVMCNVDDQMAGDRMGSGPCDLPVGALAGPIVLAAVGALLVVVGTILYAGQPRRVEG